MRKANMAQPLLDRQNSKGAFASRCYHATRSIAPIIIGIVVVVGTCHRITFAQQVQQEQSATAPQSQARLEQLVAPIALYPDALVAQILAASTYPTEVVEADRWVQQHRGLQGVQLAAAADQQPWDASVKALTAFPSVLANLDQNLSWTTTLSEAYFNQQSDVLNAVQVMRQRAESAGNLKTTPQERVTNQGSTIIVEPAYPNVCYLPSYDPWLVYGSPIVPFPGYFYSNWFGPSYVAFGPAISIGFFGGFGWGWPAWGFNWGNRVLVFNRFPYVSHSRFFFNRGPFIGSRQVFGFRQGGIPSRGGLLFRGNHVSTPNHWGGGHSWSRGSGWHGGGFGHHR
jgi:hypothetical protein